MFNISLYVISYFALQNIKMIIKINYFKHIAKHIVYFVKFLSNIQIIKDTFTR